MMQRYNCEMIDYDDCDMVECSDGIAVKWADVKDAVEAHADWVERGIWPTQTQITIECDCLFMLDSFKYSREDGSRCEWICPAHGYKRL